jgi:FAD/FMN-containing dehydrogenase
VPFTNWGATVKNSPKYTFLPTTVLGIQNIVKYARKTGRRVRCSGYRHSWSSIFSEQNEILVSFVNLDVVTRLPDPMSIVGGEYTTQDVPELKTIELKEQTSPMKRLCRVGAAVTNEEFRRWSVAGNAWALPCNVIMVEITIGGSNAPICHGAGLRHKTLSDYVRRIEYVDCHGEKQTIDDRDLIRAAAGACG